MRPRSRWPPGRSRLPSGGGAVSRGGSGRAQLLAALTWDPTACSHH